MATYYYQYATLPKTSNSTLRYGSSSTGPWTTASKVSAILTFNTTYSPLYWYEEADAGYCFADGAIITSPVALIGGAKATTRATVNNRAAHPIMATFEDKNGNLSHCWQINYIDKNGVTTQVTSVRSGLEKLSKPSLTGGLLDSTTFDLRITNNNSVAVTAHLSGEWQSSSNSYEIDRTINIPANSYMSVQFTDDCEFEWIDCYVYFSASSYEDSDESTYQY